MYLSSRAKSEPFKPYPKVHSVPEVGNPSAYRGQAGGNEAGSQCAGLESQVLSEGAATAAFQIIAARHECWPSVTTLSRFSGKAGNENF